jgi:hypothetical protein
VKDYIGQLQDAIRNLHGCESSYLETVPVTETFRGETVWSGEVEVFELLDHPKASHAYAWSHKAGKNDKETRYITVLQIPPVTSPETAVRAAIAAEIQNARQKTKGR